MNLQKILTIIAGIVGVIAAFFLVRIIGTGDEAIKAGEALGTVSTFMYIAYFILAIAVILTLVFTLKNVFTNTKALKSTLIGVGAFLVVLLIAYMLTGGDTTKYFYNGMQATEKQSHLVGAGLVAFYVLAAVAVLSMVFSGIKKMIK